MLAHNAHSAGAPTSTPDVNHQTGNYIARNYPHRGWKTQIWEGGTKVAGFISSPLLPASVRGSDYTGLFHVRCSLALGFGFVWNQNVGCFRLFVILPTMLGLKLEMFGR
jgi:hypothetical protein